MNPKHVNSAFYSQFLTYTHVTFTQKRPLSKTVNEDKTPPTPFYHRAYTPTAHPARSTARPHAIPRLSHSTFSLLPPTSCHAIGTSTTGILADSASISISTSKIQPSLCMCGMMYGSDAREKSLKPHCVSRMADVAGGVRTRRRKWKECMRNWRIKDRYWDEKRLAHELGSAFASKGLGQLQGGS